MKKRIIIALVILIIAVIAIFTCSPFIIELNGQQEMTIAYQQTYEEAGASSFLPFGQVEYEGYVDTTKLGTYEITYHFLMASKRRIIKVVDDERPVITLNGYREITIPLNGSYEDDGYFASDNYDGDISENVVVTNSLNSAIEGEYVITYEVCDSSGNKTRERRTITVTKNNPMSAPLNEYDINPYFPDTILQYTDEDTSENLENLTFFGDSIMGNLGFFGYIATDSHFWSRSSMTPENLDYRIINVACSGAGTFYEELAARKPSDLLILIGTETMVSSSANYLVACYEEAIQKMLEISPDTHYIIMSILPFTKEMESTNDSRNTEINKANYMLCQLCEKYGLHFMNVAEALKDENGVGADELYQDDHIHPGAGKGCQVMFEYICTHLSY